jgi:hypothetical protein
VRPKPTASGRAALTGSAVPVNHRWEIPERNAKKPRLRGRLLESINLGFTNQKTDLDSHRGSPRYGAGQSQAFQAWWVALGYPLMVIA